MMPPAHNIVVMTYLLWWIQSARCKHI